MTMISKEIAKTVKDLEVYKRAYAVSLEIQRHTKTFPAEERYALTDQMRRCSRSICATLAEGFAKQRHSTAEFKRFIAMAEGSACEMSVWIDYCHDFGYIDSTCHLAWQEAYLIVARMLNRLHQKAGSNH
jgi:four helix bundle protein